MRRTIILACTVSMAAAGCAKKEPAPPSAPAASARTAAVRVGGVLSGQTVQEPKKIKHVNPSYPAAARAARIQGVVMMEGTISEQGRVVDVKILGGPEELREPAVRAVEQWKYEPTIMNGAPVAVLMTMTVNFTLK